MKLSVKVSVEKLKSDYLNLVKAGLKLQKKGDIKAYTKNAIRAENLAQKLQSLSKQHAV